MPTKTDNERSFLIGQLGLSDIAGAAMSLSDLQNAFFANPSVGRPLGTAVLRHASVDTSVLRTSVAVGDLDAALAVTFTVPASGKVIVCMTAHCTSAGVGNGQIWSLRSGGGEVPLSDQNLSSSSSGQLASYREVFPGLTPGQVLTWRWGWRGVNAAGNNGVYHGPTYGALVMEVWGA